MAKRKIPTNMQPWTANINGEEYEYESGITADVPDEVAALIDFIDESAPKRDPKAAQRAIEDEVTQIVKDNFAGGVGYEETSEVVMLPETSFECVAGTLQAIISESFPYTFEVGQDYTVTLDGEAKTYTAIEVNVVGMLTNTSVADMQAGSGWGIQTLNGQCIFATIDPSLVGAHTISISGVATVVCKFEEKYIPNEPIVLNRNFYQTQPKSVLIDIVKAFNNGRSVVIKKDDSTDLFCGKLLYCGYSDTIGFQFIYVLYDRIYLINGSPDNWTKTSCTLTFS